MKRILITLFVVLGISSRIHSANYYWVGGTGSWPDYAAHWATTSGGSLFHMQVPGANDTVIFDTLSFVSQNDTVFADSSVLYCYNMKWINVQFHPVFTNSTLTSNAILKIYGSLDLDTGMTWAFHGITRFYGLNPGNTIETNGNYISRIEFCGDTAGSWQLTDSLNTGTLVFATGKFYSNNKTIRCYTFQFWANNHAEVYLDSSYLEIANFIHDDHAYLFDAMNSTIRFTGALFNGDGNHFGKVIFPNKCDLYTSDYFEEAVIESGLTLRYDNTFRRLFMPNPGTAITIYSGKVLNVVDTFVVSGSCNSMNAIFSSSYGTAFINKTNGTVLADHIVLDDVTASGGASFNATNAFINGNTIGWNVSSPVIPRTLYWVAGNGDWSDTAHWSATSGGMAGECPPTPADIVFVDSLSFPSSGDLIQTSVSNIFFHSLDWQNANNNMFHFLLASCHSYGSLTLTNQMAVNAGGISFRDTGVTTIIRTNGHLLNDISFIGTGERNLLDSIHSTGDINLIHGICHSNGNKIRSSALTIYGGTQMDFAGSDLQLAVSYSASSPLLSSPSRVTTYHFNDQSANYYPLVIFPGHGNINGNNTQIRRADFYGSASLIGTNIFDSLRFFSSGTDISFQSGSTQQINNYLYVSSSCAGMTMIHSSSEGSQANLLKNSGIVTLNDVILQDIHAGGGASFNALTSVAIANVTGWNITPPPPVDMYWIGGTGNWNDPQHWSTSSGGNPGTCVPNPLSDVYFDSSSFVGTTDSVRINIPYAYCHNMKWDGTLGTPAMLVKNSVNVLRCYGSFELDTNVIAENSAVLFRAVTPGNTVNANNQRIGYVAFNGLNGFWTLTGHMRAYTLSMERGTLKTAGFNIESDYVTTSQDGIKHIKLDSSFVFAGDWEMQDTSILTLEAEQAQMVISGNVFAGGTGQRYNAVTFSGDVTLTNEDSISYARFTKMVWINDNTYFDSLFFDNPGQQISIESGKTVTVSGKINCAATAASPIGIESSQGFVPSTIFKTADTVCLDFLNLRGMTATGGAVFYSGSNSSDAGNNSGWTWNSCNPTFVNVWPGDANRDLTADNLDLLAVGVAFNKSGSQRANASLNWVAQPAYTWNTLFANSSDIVNADCDGDGVIGFSDTTAILLNYGLTHPAREPQPDSIQSTGPKLWMSMPQYAVNSGDTASIGIMLGEAVNPASNVYGIAFTLHYNDSNIVPGSVWIEFNGSWMCPTGSVVYLVKHFPSQEAMEIGLSRIDHQNVSGFGEIARVHFQTVPGFTGMLKAWYTDVTLIDAHEVPIPTSVQLGYFNIVGMEENTVSGFNGYPNPTNGMYIIEDEKLAGQNATVLVMDMTGRIVQQHKTQNEKRVELNLEALPVGTYFIRIEAENAVFVQRVVKE